VTPIRLFLVDDSAEFLESAARFLSADPVIAVVGRAMSGEAALDAVEQAQPDLILMDVAMPGIGGIEAARRLKARRNPPRIIMLTLYDNPEYRALAQEAGADGFVRKSDFATDMRAVIADLVRWEETAVEGKEPAPVKHVLIVDDSTTLRRMVVASLRNMEGLRFSEANSGLEAIERLALDPVDVIILDLNMPDMHGFEVLQFLRKHPIFRGVKVIVLTTRGDEQSRTDALAAGAAHYLTKPFQPETLAALVQEVMAE
jgi:two-component system, chemotaxis family, chemotaxis protein CheY